MLIHISEKSHNIRFHDPPASIFSTLELHCVSSRLAPTVILPSFILSPFLRHLLINSIHTSPRPSITIFFQTLSFFKLSCPAALPQYPFYTHTHSHYTFFPLSQVQFFHRISLLLTGKPRKPKVRHPQQTSQTTTLQKEKWTHHQLSKLCLGGKSKLRWVDKIYDLKNKKEITGGKQHMS